MLTIVGGPMFSGKTSWLLGYVHSLPHDSYKLFKPAIDTRYATNAVVTHTGLQLPAQNLNIQTPRFPKIPRSVTTILIDELNFFQPEGLLSAIAEQVSLGKTVVGAGLLYDFQKKPFGATLPLSKKADAFIQLYARCDNCGKKAKHSYRKAQNTSQVMLGAAETYGACCTACWIQLSKQHLV